MPTPPRRKKATAVQNPLETYLRDINETSLLTADDLNDILGQIFGGGTAQRLPDVVKQFEEKGMRDQVDSWVRTGPNKPVERRQIEDAFGTRELEELARRRGVDRDQLAEVLAKYIPRIIDELTPAGQLPRR